MAQEQINARDWVFEVSGDAGTTWTEINGLESFSYNPSEAEESATTTTFASGGVEESQAMQRGASLNLSGKHYKDPATGADDPGQAIVNDLATQVGSASLGPVRFRHVSDTDWTRWTAWVSRGEASGGTNDKTAWSATFRRSGAASTETVV